MLGFFKLLQSKVFNQNLIRSDQSVSEHASQTLAGHSQVGTAHCTWGTPSSGFQHVPQTCSDRS